MANDGGGSSAGGKEGGPVGVFARYTGYVVAATVFIAALDAFFREAQSFTCHLVVALPWCEETIQEPCSPDLSLEEYLKCSG